MFPVSPVSRRIAIAAALALSLPLSAIAQKKYDTGASDKEIVIGNTVPYSGPASAYGTVGKAMNAVFEKVNAEGGINGRKIKFISLDDGYNPAKTVEQARKLVEEDEVLFLLSPLGTAQNTAIHKYMNQKKVPHLFLNTGANKWGDPKNFPWTMGFIPSYYVEGRAFAKHILATKPNAKVGVLYQNDDFGKDYLKGVLEGLGDKAKTMVVSQQSYEASDTTVDSQVLSLKATGADTFVNITTPKFAAQAIRRAAESGWKPVQYLVSVSTSVTSVLKPAGFDNGQGVFSSAYLRDPSDPSNHASKEYQDYAAVMKKYYPSGDVGDSLNANGYTIGQAAVEVLKKAGDNLTRENIMKIAANLNLTLPMLSPGITLRTSPDDFYPVSQLQLTKFAGQRFEHFGPIIDR
ncbi:MAG TPA: ABC transporter substrate-binding protein [Aquabacterium sp.]|nr:ABC transporter substrate-binding protein [Aquabacterium sp.]HQC94154.1 ABC transporter substrate-binding protein [Aquabacterium sp.]